MIKIEVREKTWNKIVNKHWKWFEKHLKTKFKKNNIHKGMTYEDFLKSELNYSIAELEELIKIPWKKLSDYTNTASIFYKKYIAWYQKIENDPNKDLKTYRHNLDLCFGYNSFMQNEQRAYSFTTSLGVEVCPYCNRSYIFTSKKEEKGKETKYICRPEIDHYFPKSLFPYLSCTPANFIPSCHQCNHKKSDYYNTTDNNTYTLYPYLEGFDDNTVFNFSYKNASKTDYKITIKNNGSKKEINSIDAFNLESLYNMHKIEIEDLIERYRCYSNPKLDDILRLFPTVDKNSGMRISKLVIKRLRNEILGIPLVDDSKMYPLKKFKTDLIAQFDREVAEGKKQS